jgi:hypothetical protein
MKSVILSFMVMLITMVSINTANAQAVKFHAKEPPNITKQAVYTNPNTDFQYCATGTLYGCGNASSVTAYLVVEGTASTSCFVKGNGTGQDDESVPGQSSFKASSPSQTFDATNGAAAFSLCVNIGGSCKGGGMDHYEVTGVTITNAYLVVNGKQVSLNGF